MQPDDIGLSHVIGQAVESMSPPAMADVTPKRRFSTTKQPLTTSSTETATRVTAQMAVDLANTVMQLIVWHCSLQLIVGTAAPT